MAFSRNSMGVILCLIVAATNIGKVFSRNLMDTGMHGLSVNQATSGNSSDQCVCLVEVPVTIQCSKIVSSDTTEKIIDLQTQVSRLDVRLNDHVAVYHTQSLRIDEVSELLITTLDTLERVESGALVISRPEIVQIRRELLDMEAMLVSLKQNHSATVVIQDLQREIYNVTILLDELEISESADTSKLLKEIEALKSRLEDCKSNGETTILYDSWEEEGTQDSCGNLLSVSLPYTVGALRSQYGAWFRDPIKNTKQVVSFNLENGRNSRDISTFNTLKDYHSNENAVNIRLQHDVEGTGLVAYNGSLYYNVYGSHNIARYDLTFNQQLTVKTIPDSGDYAYRSGAYTDFDLLTDEKGLWVVYSSSAASGFILISKLNSETLDVLQTWRTNYPKNAAGNCFIVCGVLYCTNGFQSHDNKINYRYDTKTSTEEFLDIPFDNKYLNTYSLNYNPRDQKLYGWDRGHQVIYDLFFNDNAPQSVDVTTESANPIPLL